LKTTLFQLLFALSLTVIANNFGMAQVTLNPKPLAKEPSETTLTKTNTDLVFNSEIKEVKRDSISNDSISKPKSFLEGIVDYKAKDITSINVKKQQIYLKNEAEIQYKDMDIKAGVIIYLKNEAEIQYKDMDIKAGVIIIDYGKDMIYAGRLKDSLGVYSQHPVFKQGNDLVEPDSIAFNIKTKKALIWNSKTEQQGGRIISELTKKENDSVYFVKRAKFTTSENIENPEYYFLLRKAKIVPGEKVVTGLTNMFIANVPTPIGFPFAFLPMSKKRTSGVIFPTFGEQNNRGYFLQNGGYYFALSDYFDLATLGDYYTNGSYGARIESSYAFVIGLEVL